MNVPTILCFVVLFVSNIALWGLLFLQLEWDKNTDEQLDVLNKDNKTLEKHVDKAVQISRECLSQKRRVNEMWQRLNKLELTNIVYADTGSVKESEEQNES